MDNERVLMLSIGYGELGGVGTVTKELSESLRSKGHDVDVLTFWPWRRDEGKSPFVFSASDGQERAYQTLDDFVVAQGAKQYDAMHLHSHIFADGYLSMVQRTADLASFLERYDCPKVLLTHSIVARKSMMDGGTNFEIEAQKQVMNLCDAVVHLTDEQQEIADRAYPEFAAKTVVVGNGTFLPEKTDCAEVAAYRGKLAPNGQKLGLYLGRLSPEKGLKELIEALPEIKGAHPDFKLVVAGNKGDQYEKEARERLSALGLKEGKDYEFVGWVTDSKVKQKLICASDFLVMPSHFEHFPMAALESMVNGTPVIISDVEGPRSVFRLQDRISNRLALPIKKISSPYSIADAVCWALENPAQMKAIAERAKKEVETRHTWDVVSDKYLELYKSLKTNRKARPKAQMPRVGVVVPTYNRKELAKETIDSLLSQDFDGSFKIAVVDDGSVDGTFDFLRKAYEKDLDYTEDFANGSREVVNGNKGRIVLVRQKNKGVAAARNTGLRILYYLGCKYFAHQDSGDVALSNRLSALVKFLDGNQQFGIVHAKSRDIDEDGSPAKNKVYENFFSRHWDRARNGLHKPGDIGKDHQYVHNQTTMFTRDAVNALGLHNLHWEGMKYGSDRDFYIKLENAGVKFGFCDEYVSLSRQHSDGMTANANADAKAAVLASVKKILQAQTPEEKKAAYMAAAANHTLRAVLGNKALSEDHFQIVFDLSFRRNFHRNRGELDEALRFAEEVFNLSPTPENFKAKAEIEFEMKKR